MSSLESSVTLDISDTVEAVAKGAEGGQLEITFYYIGGDEREHLHTDTVPKGFYKKRTVRGQLKNDVADSLDDVPLTADQWVSDWSAWVSEYQAADAEARPELVPECVRMLAEGTESVEVSVGGETREWTVTVEWNGKTGEIVLDHNDMAAGGYMALRQQLFKEFADSPDFAKEDWESLKSYWISIQEETTVETMTETDRAVESFLNEVQHRAVPHEDIEAMQNSKESAWVDWENEHEATGIDPGHGGVVWVRGDLISSVLDSLDVSIQVGALGTELQKRGKTLRGSQALQPEGPDTKRRYWFFDADAFGWGEMDVHTSDTGDAPGEVDA